ncbi:hypothetical protein GWC95_10800 [Sediminibacterium roseum]|uniref:Uncharacterized protein n=1 Tax=Sediminibacterium roseum TaxID=1978412 RepID=A0ABW9ZXJ2_9BACT|nr:hypothetical protein [Sediminibacterium roseum]NCI50412.1 hypothetical protein [Sediminibacterium roseum]
MKKILVVAVVGVLSVIGSKTFAQTANLNITLSDVLSFTVSQPAGLSVNFDSESKYNNGITALATDHISVVSSRGYVIKAKAGTVTGSASLLPGTIKITSAIGATNNGNTAGLTFQSDVVLPASSGAAATIVTASNSSWDGANSTNKFNISYLIGANGAYAGKATGANVIPVVYTVTQP